MNNIDFNNPQSKVYKITSLTAYIYAAILLLFLVYKETLYVDQTWFHGFFTMFFSIFSALIFVGILFVFSKFLNHILDYKKTNTLLFSYILFTILSTVSILLVLISSLQVYAQQNDLTTLANFAQTSTSSLVLLILSRIGLFFTGIMLGISIQKVKVTPNSIFKILGILFIVHKLFALVESINLIKTEAISSLITVAIVAIIGYVLTQKFEINEKGKTTFEPLSKQTPTPTNEILLNEFSKDYTTQNATEDDLNPNNPTETNTSTPEKIDLTTSEFKTEAINYYNNLNDVEKTRLNYIITKNNEAVLSESERYNLVITYIIEKKLFDYNRFAPK